MTSTGSRMIAFSSRSTSAPYTAPVGLLGEFRMSALVRGVSAAAMRPMSGWKLAPVSTVTTRPP